MTNHLAPGECMTEAERLAMLARVNEIRLAYKAGDMTLAQAQHEAHEVLAPLFRRVRRIARQRHPDTVEGEQ